MSLFLVERCLRLPIHMDRGIIESAPIFEENRLLPIALAASRIGKSWGR